MQSRAIIPTTQRQTSHIIIQSFFPSFAIALANSASSSANICFSLSLSNPFRALSFIALRLLSISARARRSVLENGLWICEVDEDPAVGVDDVVGGRDGAPDLVAVTGTGAFARNGIKLDPTCVLEGEEELVLFEDPIREPIATKGFEGTFVEAWDDEEVDVTTHLCELQ